MRKLTLLFVVAFLFNQATHSQSPPSASQILDEAKKLASQQKKNIFILFHASWCRWCHKMDSAMNDKSVKNFFTDNYVIRHLVVMESPDKKHLENEGALAMLYKANGMNQGIPYWIVLDSSGKLLADSRMPAETDGSGGFNAGYPAHEKEAAYFIQVLQKTSLLKPGELKIIETRFREGK